MKKIFYIFFAFYFLSLSVIPCNDEQDCKESDHSEQVAQTDHHAHENETCTPFCVCSCCASHVIFSNFSTEFSVDTETKTVYSNQTTADISSAVITIWQPPKLS